MTDASPSPDERRRKHRFASPQARRSKSTSRRRRRRRSTRRKCRSRSSSKTTSSSSSTSRPDWSCIPRPDIADRTLVNALLFHVKDLSGIGGELRPGIVHRLDKDTSGVMVIAKNDEAHRKLTAAWGSEARAQGVRRARLRNAEADAGTIDAPIGRDPRDRKRWPSSPAAVTPITDYEVVERLRHASLAPLPPPHRPHAPDPRPPQDDLGHPIIGDPLYSGPQWRGIPDKTAAESDRRVPASGAARRADHVPASAQRRTDGVRSAAAGGHAGVAGAVAFILERQTGVYPERSEGSMVRQRCRWFCSQLLHRRCFASLSMKDTLGGPTAAHVVLLAAVAPPDASLCSA